MAITRAQQVRQMYKRGTGLGGNRGPQGVHKVLRVVRLLEEIMVEIDLVE